MKLLTEWKEWFVSGRDEQKFHCDLILAPDEAITIVAYGTDGGTENIQVIGSTRRFAKVHLAASWEFRGTEFVE